MPDIVALERAVAMRRRTAIELEGHPVAVDALIAAVVALERARHPMQVAEEESRG